jgi:hypothetical protein
MACKIMIRQLIAFLVVLSSIVEATAEPSVSVERVGDIYEIQHIKIWSTVHDNGDTEGSNNKFTLLEYIVGVREDGLELKYDLPQSLSKNNRAKDWRFPVTLFRATSGQIEILNRAELESRIDKWLEDAKLARSDCGRRIFTWNLVQIDCDPLSVIEGLAGFDLRTVKPEDGASYQDAVYRGVMKQTVAGPSGFTFAIELGVDRNAVIRERAQFDLVMAELSKKPLTLDAAIRARSSETVSGTISIYFDTDALKQVQRRTKVTKQKIARANGKSETQNITETVERKILPR